MCGSQWGQYPTFFINIIISNLEMEVIGYAMTVAMTIVCFVQKLQNSLQSTDKSNSHKKSKDMMPKRYV